MPQRCSEPMCAANAKAVVIYNDEASRYCKLCLEVFVIETMEALTHGESVTITVEREAARGALPVYRVV